MAAVDQDGNVLDILVQPKRNAQAAKRFFRRLLKDPEYVPRVIVTDKPRSYGAAHRTVMPSVEPLADVSEQPRGEQPPAHEAARARDETLPPSRRSTTVPFRLLRNLTPASGPAATCAPPTPAAPT